MRRLLLLTVLLLIVLPLPVSGAGRDGGGVSGRIGFRYADFQAEGDGGAVDANSFAQQYSLLYRDAGLLNGGRGGSYSYLLGAEYTSFSNSINGTDDSLDTYKPLYSGQLLLAPGGLPFRLKLYCGDTHVTTLIEDNVPQLQANLLQPGIVTDFTNGKRREIGANLQVGIKNGSYLGNYRETLSKWPRLLMDYRSLEVESFHSKTPQNYMQRDLAFVSLNKKDNWFHYRYRDFQDYLRPDGAYDYETKSYILGTIDPQLQRAWVNLTNWIKISGEGTFTDNSYYYDESETYAVNLFAVGKREGMRSSVFSQFLRERDRNSLRRTLAVPVTVQNRVDRNTSWQLNFSLDRVQDEGLTVADNDDVVYLGLRVDTRQGRPYTVSPQTRFELFDGNTDTGSALEAGVEVANRRSATTAGDSRALFLVRRFSGTGRGGESINYVEEELNFRHEQRYSTWRIGGEESLWLGNGNISSDFGHRITAKTSSGQTYAASGEVGRDGRTLHSITRLYGENGLGRPLTNRLQLLFDYLSTDLDTNLQSSLTHYLTATSGRTLRYQMTNELIFGEGQTAYRGSLSGGDIGQATPSDFTRTLSHTSELDYTPGRTFQAGVSFQVKLLSGGNVNSLHYIGQQDCRYTFFRINGVVRPLVILEEELTYEVSRIGDAEATLTGFIFKADYFPTRHFSLGAFSDYELATYGASETETLTGSLSAGWTYPMLALRMIYSQGMRTTDDRERDERGVKVQLDKTF